MLNGQVVSLFFWYNIILKLCCSERTSSAVTTYYRVFQWKEVLEHFLQQRPVQPFHLQDPPFGVFSRPGPARALGSCSHHERWKPDASALETRVCDDRNHEDDKRMWETQSEIASDAMKFNLSTALLLAQEIYCIYFLKHCFIEVHVDQKTHIYSYLI